MIGRIVVDDIRPSAPGGYPGKAVIGQATRLSADVFRDGHDVLAAKVRWRPVGNGTATGKGKAKGKPWSEAPMTPAENDRWEAWVELTTLGRHEVVVEAWTDRYETWRHDVTVKLDAGQDVEVELEEGARHLDGRLAEANANGSGGGAPAHDLAVLSAAIDALCDESKPQAERAAPAMSAEVAAIVDRHPERADLTISEPQPVWVDRERALVGAWYELFPRSEGGLAGTIERLPAIAAMGFDVVYLPPIHPIGHTFRKGRNNTLVAQPGDPGSPWAIGSEEGGHTAVHPELGTIDDFDRLVAAADRLGLEVALDCALQCSPDHPWVREHPEWFHQRPDGSIKYAENPPKKYQDIYPINFWPADDADRAALWQACKDVLDHWIGHGVRIFRVDNPHTKPLAFWEWMIDGVHAEHPDVVFLAEAFTRPKMMAKLAAVGFSQSYTYFTWRTTKQELVEYVTEIALGSKADYMRPNFWPNTPDILSGPLRRGPWSAFRLRLLLAATLVPSYGVYSGYELGENEPASETNEEYLYSEKYEIKRRDWERPDSLVPFVARLNEVRRRHPAFSELGNVWFHWSNNDQILAYSKATRDGSDVVLVVVNLDPHAAQEDTLWVDLGRLGLPWEGPYEAHDELTGATYVWNGPNPYVRLDPAVQVAHVLHLRQA